MTTTEIREAIRVPISGGPMLVTGRSAEILIEAARAYADLLEQGKRITLDPSPWPEWAGGVFLVIPVDDVENVLRGESP